MKKRFLVRTMVLAVALSMSAFVACGKTDTVDESNMVTNEEQADDGNQATNEEEESNITSPVLAAMEKYDSIISGLQPGQAYAFADICTEFDVLLVSEDGAYDCGDGTMGALNVKIYGLDADGNVMEYGVASSGHTAYPLAVYDGCLMTCNNSRTMMEYIDANSLSMTTKKCVELSYDEDGNASYSFMDADTQTDGVTDDDSMMQEMYDMYSEAVVINFTTVE